MEIINCYQTFNWFKISIIPIICALWHLQEVENINFWKPETITVQNTFGCGQKFHGKNNVFYQLEVPPLAYSIGA